MKKYFVSICLVSLIILSIVLAFILPRKSRVEHQQTLAAHQTNIPALLQPTPTEIPSQFHVIKKAEADIQNGFCLHMPVLLYHHIEPYREAQHAGHAQLTVDSSIFEQQIQYLINNGYKTISSEELPQALAEHHSLPEKSIMITIDDGYSDVYTYAYPIAKKYNVVLNLMISTGLVGNLGYINWGELKEMSNSGVVYIYNHTWSHYPLAKGDATKIQFELVMANHQLEQNLGKKADVLVYPYGSYNSQVINIAKQDGFIGAYGTSPSFTQCESSLYDLHRNHVGNMPLSSYGL